MIRDCRTLKLNSVFTVEKYHTYLRSSANTGIATQSVNFKSYAVAHLSHPDNGGWQVLRLLLCEHRIYDMGPWWIMSRAFSLCSCLSLVSLWHWHPSAGQLCGHVPLLTRGHFQQSNSPPHNRALLGQHLSGWMHHSHPCLRSYALLDIQPELQIFQVLTQY